MFKIGDLVKINNLPFGDHKLKKSLIGKKGKIVKIDDFNGRDVYVVNIINRWWIFYDFNLKKVENLPEYLFTLD